MKQFFVLLLVVLFLGGVAASAQSPDEQYVRVYNLIQQADTLRTANQADQALPKYLEANTALTQIKRSYPEWQPAVVNYRLQYLAEKIETITGTQPTAKPVPATTTAPSPTAPTKDSTPTVTPELQKQLADLQESVRRLQAERQVLEAKLKEAFTTQPAAIDPRELTKAQERVQTLLKANELLKAGLEAEKTRPAIAANAKELEEARAALAEANTRLGEQRTANEQLVAEKNALQTRVNQLTTSAASAEVLRAENELLKKQLAEAKTETGDNAAETARKLSAAEARIAALQSDAEVLRLEKIALENRLKQAQTAPATATVAVKSAPVSREADLEKIKELERQRDVLRKRLDEANMAIQTGQARMLNDRVQELTREVASLKARVEVFEAKAIPYSAEELALFEKPKARPAPVPRTETIATRRTTQDLPVNTVNLLAQAEKHFANKDYAKAEENYLTLLRQDDKSALTHVNLAAIQMEQGRLAEAEQSLEKALAIAPEDPHSVALLGYLKFRQDKYDESIETLNRAAKLNPQNADVQNYLGVSLSHKGLRGPAEQAFRRAVVLSPGHAGAHNNLAVFYASEEPPNLPLARFHYQKALAAGHPQNPDIEKLFEKKEKAAAN